MTRPVRIIAFTDDLLKPAWRNRRVALAQLGPQKDFALHIALAAHDLANNPRFERLEQHRPAGKAGRRLRLHRQGAHGRCHQRYLHHQ
jgi:hypothetical protein